MSRVLRKKSWISLDDLAYQEKGCVSLFAAREASSTPHLRKKILLAVFANEQSVVDLKSPDCTPPLSAHDDNAHVCVADASIGSPEAIVFVFYCFEGARRMPRGSIFGIYQQIIAIIELAQTEWKRWSLFFKALWKNSICVNVNALQVQNDPSLPSSF